MCYCSKSWVFASGFREHGKQQSCYARETLLEENERLRRELEDARAELREVQHYAAGLEYTVRHLPAMTVMNNYENKT